MTPSTENNMIRFENIMDQIRRLAEEARTLTPDSLQEAAYNGWYGNIITALTDYNDIKLCSTTMEDTLNSIPSAERSQEAS